MANSKKHAHMYHRKRIYQGKQPVWACGFSDCSHYMPFGTVDEMLVNKQSTCWECGKPFSLSIDKLENEYPCCSVECQTRMDAAMELTTYAMRESDPFMKAQRERLELIDKYSKATGDIPQQSLQQTTQNPDKKICKSCGKPTNTDATICIPCAAMGRW